MSPHRRLLVASLLLAVAAPGTAGARPHVVSAYLWRTSEQLHLAFRTDRALPEQVNFPQTQVTPSGSFYTVSDSLHCYQVDITLEHGALIVGTDVRARPGDAVRVKIGNRGRIYNRRLEVLGRNRYYQRGAPIGCTRDPKANYVLFNLFPTPEVEPRRFFFTANSGPYLDRLRWTGWGTAHATATGRYISNCASCGPKIVKQTTVVLDRSVLCAPWGPATRAYRGHTTVYDTNRNPVRQEIGTTDVYC